MSTTINFRLASPLVTDEGTTVHRNRRHLLQTKECFEPFENFDLLDFYQNEHSQPYPQVAPSLSQVDRPVQLDQHDCIHDILLQVDLAPLNEDHVMCKTMQIETLHFNIIDSLQVNHYYFVLLWFKHLLSLCCYEKGDIMLLSCQLHEYLR